MELSLEDFQVHGVTYARVEVNRIMNLAWAQQGNSFLRFRNEAARIAC